MSERERLIVMVEAAFCRCHEDYRDRWLADPACQAHDFAEWFRAPFPAETAALIRLPRKNGKSAAKKGCA